MKDKQRESVAFDLAKVDIAAKNASEALSNFWHREGNRRDNCQGA